MMVGAINDVDIIIPCGDLPKLIKAVSDHTDTVQVSRFEVSPRYTPVFAQNYSGSDMEPQERERSSASKGSKKSKRSRSLKKRSNTDSPYAEVAGIAKTPDQNRHESEHSVASTVQEGSDFKKGRRSKKPRSLPSDALEATKREAEQGGAMVPARPTEPERINRVQQQPQDGKGRMQQSRRSSVGHDDRKTRFMTASRRRVFDGAIFAVFVLNVMAVVWLLIRAWDSEDVYVTVPGLGAIRGIRATVEHQPVYMFRGIQYARSPEGALRFAAASAVSQRNSTDIDARMPKPGCVQKPYMAHGQVIRSNEGTTEDCLHLNVWTPCTERTVPGCRKTVLVFFHAIEFQNGDNNYYDGRWLAGLGHLVVVAPNFRLGAFGFLNIACLLGDAPCAATDVALGDQWMAVQWVLDHISSFGGNASDVVLMGSASGAWSLGAHLLKDGTHGPRFWNRERFAKVILMGESPFRRYFDDKSHELPSLLNCSRGGTVEMLECLRIVPSRDIVRVTSEVVHYFGPSASAHPSVQDAARVTGRRFLLGTVSNEGTHLLDYLRRTSPPNAGMDNVVPVFLKRIYHINNGGEIIDAFRKANAPDENVTTSGISWASELLGDMFYTCPLLRLGRELSMRERNLVFGYVFDHRPSFALFNDTTGSARFMDLDFVFGRPLDGSRAANEQEQELSRRMIDMWATFAKTGNLPFVNGQPWPRYTEDGKDVQVRIGLTHIEWNVAAHIITGRSNHSDQASVALQAYYRSCVTEIWQPGLRLKGATEAILEIANTKKRMSQAHLLHFTLEVQFRYNLNSLFVVGNQSGMAYLARNLLLYDDYAHLCDRDCYSTVLAALNVHVGANCTVEEMFEWEQLFADAFSAPQNASWGELRAIFGGIEAGAFKAIFLEFQIDFDAVEFVLVDSKAELFADIQLVWNLANQPLSLCHALALLVMNAMQLSLHNDATLNQPTAQSIE
ncbi:hypothetical protein HPB52_011345 [Rhipicephalus sanguineus]|uniref:Carboxylesterase type B domain-containing protein n=1 Tax=Rhipicephalus sanguineus TaxID=34632 RepID=A0A9D4SPL1_RHISA|nr:hypothetical protein HPB52_011345 [Rhipicephalus sanguineus]